MAELLGRKPLFPGRDYMHQLHLIIDTLGTPSLEDTEYIASEKVLLPFNRAASFLMTNIPTLGMLSNAQAKRYIRSLEPRPAVPFETLFPQASPVGTRPKFLCSLLLA
jgi:hypothetical protein